MTTAEILARAADLIEPEGAWTQGCMARNADGDRTNAFSPEASSWCVEGAIRAAAARCGSSDILAGLSTREAMMAFGEIEHFVLWNDAPGRTQQEVVAALRLASARAKEVSDA